MARIVFEAQIDAPISEIVQRWTRRLGIAGGWTPTVEFAGGVGWVMRPGLASAPQPLTLSVDDVSTERVTWISSGDFPPHWVGTASPGP